MDKHCCEQIISALDRLQEAHYWIHMMEEHYHRADLFRWYLNSYLRALKEVNQLLQMELQHNKAIAEWFRKERAHLHDHPLLQHLSKKRDVLVHQKRLVPRSILYIALTDSKVLRSYFKIPINPLEDSDSAMKRYVEYVRENDDIFGILVPDEDTTPCVYREWRLDECNEELVSMCVKAWFRMSESISETINMLGEPHDGFTLECRHDRPNYLITRYDRKKLKDNVNRSTEGWLHESRIWIPSGQPA